MAIVAWGDDRREEAHTADELDALLDQVASEAQAAGMPQDGFDTFGICNGR